MTSWAVPLNRGHRRRRVRRTASLVMAIVATVAMVGACSGGASSNQGGSDSTLTMVSSGPWTTWEYNPWSTNFPGAANNLVYLPLAVQNWPSLTSYTPQLAQDWSVHGKQLTVTLHGNAKWQDGSAVTSKDVIDTIDLNSLTGGGVWNDITTVSSQGPAKVVLTARPDVPMQLLESDLLTGVTPRPAAVWGKFDTPQVQKDIKNYYHQAQHDPAAAANSAAFKDMSSAFQKLTKFHPKTLIGDGPYKLSGITTNEAHLDKWSGFFDARRITIPHIAYLGAAQPQVNADLLTGRADFSEGWLYMPPAIMQKWQRTPEAHLVAVPGTFQGQIVFDEHAPPFDNPKVRQALAYALPLKQMDQQAWGATAKAHAVPPTVPEGLVDEVAAQFLTPQQRSNLEPYSYDTSKAARLLQSAGFHKSNGQWLKPDGTPFTIALTMNAGWTDQIAAFRVAVDALSSFGIKTTFSTVEGDTYLNNLHQGNFQMAAFCCTGGNPNPILDFVQSPMGSGNNYTSVGTAKGERGIGFGPDVDVPGLGHVNVPNTLDHEYRSVGAGPEMKTLAWDWARLVNQQLPYIEYADFTNQIAYSTKQFSWPPPKDPIWKQINNSSLFVIAQERGQLKPR